MARKDRRSYRKGGEDAVSTGNQKSQDQTPKPIMPDPRSDQVPLSSATGSKPLDTAAYILEMTLALRNAANDSGLDFLAYLLDMAAEEADGLVRAEAKVTVARSSRGIA